MNKNKPDKNTDKTQAKKESLTKKVVLGGFWFSFLKIASRALSLVRTFILARLLVPEDFGLMGVVTLSIAFLYQFTRLEVGMALIQKKGDIEDYYDSALALAVIRGGLIFLVLFFGSGFIADFFNNQQIVNLLKVVAFSPLILSFRSPKLVVFEKELNFQLRFWFELISTTVDIVVTIVLAFILRNVWALVFGLIAGDIFRFILSYLFCPYMPKFNISTEKIKDLFNFGKWIFVTTILGFLITRSPEMLIGRVLDMAALGFYSMAFKIANLISTEIFNIFYKVTFPAYSKIQGDIKRLRGAFLRVTQLTTFFIVPISCVTIILATEVVTLFLGEKWMPIIPTLRVLSLMSLFYSFTAVFNSLYLALGKPHLPTKFSFFRLIVLCIVIYPLTLKYNVTGTALALLISAMIIIPYNISIAIKLVDCKFSQYFKQFELTLISTVLMSVCILLLKLLLGTTPHFYSLIIYCAVGGIVYIGSVYVFDSIFHFGYKKYFKFYYIRQFLG
jgi:O-antigen/teichoic acid export membrane protein